MKTSAFWRYFPLTPGLHSVELKNRLQQRIMEDTRGATPEEVVVYFREAARRFRCEFAQAGPELVASVSAAGEPGLPPYDA